MTRRTRNYGRLIAYGAMRSHSPYVPAYIIQNASPAVRAMFTEDNYHEPTPPRMRSRALPFHWTLPWRVMWFVAKVIASFIASGFMLAGFGLLWLLLTVKV